MFARKEFVFSQQTALEHVECFAGKQSVTIGELEDFGCLVGVTPSTEL